MTARDGRAHPRYAMEIDATVHVEGEAHPARTRNVSRGGLCFFARRELPVGKDVDLDVALVFDEKTRSESLRLRARIIWCTELTQDRYQVGTVFLGVTRDNRTYLDMFVRYLEAGPDPGSAEDNDGGAEKS